MTRGTCFIGTAATRRTRRSGSAPRGCSRRATRTLGRGSGGKRTRRTSSSRGPVRRTKRGGEQADVQGRGGPRACRAPRARHPYQRGQKADVVVKVPPLRRHQLDHVNRRVLADLLGALVIAERFDHVKDRLEECGFHVVVGAVSDFFVPPPESLLQAVDGADALAGLKFLERVEWDGVSVRVAFGARDDEERDVRFGGRKAW